MHSHMTLFIWKLKLMSPENFFESKFGMIPDWGCRMVLDGDATSLKLCLKMIKFLSRWRPVKKQNKCLPSPISNCSRLIELCLKHIYTRPLKALYVKEPLNHFMILQLPVKTLAADAVLFGVNTALSHSSSSIQTSPLLRAARTPKVSAAGVCQSGPCTYKPLFHLVGLIPSFALARTPAPPVRCPDVTGMSRNIQLRARGGHNSATSILKCICCWVTETCLESVATQFIGTTHASSFDWSYSRPKLQQNQMIQYSLLNNV